MSQFVDNQNPQRQRKTIELEAREKKDRHRRFHCLLDARPHLFYDCDLYPSHATYPKYPEMTVDKPLVTRVVFFCLFFLEMEREKRGQGKEKTRTRIKPRDIGEE